MINSNENTTWLLELLSSCNVSTKEFEHRKFALEAAQKMSESEISHFNDRYYNLAHEIKSLYFLSQFGNVLISEDCNHNSGCDCKLNDHYQIECVCSSAGNKTDGIDLFGKKIKDSTFRVGRYEESFLLCRLTSSIREKLNFYKSHIKNGTISDKSPYIIFLGLGSLSNEMFAGDNGIRFTGMLFGKGNPILSIDLDTGRMTPAGYTHNKVLYNHNRSEIDCNIFSAEEYRCVSGIIISSAKLFEKYSFDNTWLFMNPMANVNIDHKDFPNMVCWDVYRGDEYVPYKDGHVIGHN